MSPPSDFDRIARAWLEDGPTELSDRVLDRALTDIHRTRQRRRGIAAWRVATMSAQARIAVAVTVVAIAVVGTVVLRSGDRSNVGANPAPTIGPSTAPTARAGAASIPPAGGPRVTMNDKGCYGEHLEGLRAATVSIETASTTEDVVQWDLLSYAAPHTWSDVAAVVIERQQGVAAGGPAGGAADWMQNVASAETRPTAALSTLRAPVTAGHYVVVCVGVAPDNSNTGVFIVGPIEITP